MLLAVPANAQTSTLPLTSGDLFKAYDNYQKGIYAKAFETFKSLSDKGDAHATYGLGVCYYNGRGTTKNLKEAFKCFDRSYNRGIKSAAFIIGKCYLYGLGVEKQIGFALTYLGAAANQGNQEAKTLIQEAKTLISNEKQRLLAKGAVDLGLPSGTLWASHNVGGITELPEENGWYFAWAAREARNNGFVWNATPYCEDTQQGLIFSKYVTDNKTTLDLSDDAAAFNWGNNWCMPTRQQFQELIDNCTWTWTTRNGKNGYEVKGKNGNSIFLPAAGSRNDYFPNTNKAGNSGVYWSSSLGDTYTYQYGFAITFNSDYHSVEVESVQRFIGCSIRPVCRERFPSLD